MPRPPYRAATVCARGDGVAVLSSQLRRCSQIYRRVWKGSIQWGSLRVSISAWATSRSLVLVSWDYRLRMANARSSTSYRSHQDPHGLADEFPGTDRCRRDR